MSNFVYFVQGSPKKYILPKNEWIE